MMGLQWGIFCSPRVSLNHREWGALPDKPGLSVWKFILHDIL